MHRASQKGVFTRRAGGKLFAIDKANQALDDVEQYLADLALVGSDTLTEKSELKLSQQAVARLSCMMVFAIQKNAKLPSRQGVVVATSYPRALRQFMTDRGITSYDYVYRPGKLENAIARGLADAIFDIRETGKSLVVNELDVIGLGAPIDLCAVWRADEAGTTV